MAQERSIAMIAMALLLCFLLNCNTTSATTFLVGDANGGWDFGVSNWPNGKSFKAGDILEFTYDRAIHNVAVVDKKAYDSCTIPDNAPVFQTGDDRITLKKGDNYFACGIPGHCAAGLKLAVTAA